MSDALAGCVGLGTPDKRTIAVAGIQTIAAHLAADATLCDPFRSTAPRIACGFLVETAGLVDTTAGDGRGAEKHPHRDTKHGERLEAEH